MASDFVCLLSSWLSFLGFLFPSFLTPPREGVGETMRGGCGAQRVEREGGGVKDFWI